VFLVGVANLVMAEGAYARKHNRSAPAAPSLFNLHRETRK